MRTVAAKDPELARKALAGLRAYEEVERPPAAEIRPAIARAGGAALRDYGGDGPPAILVPSLINPPRILDLDRETSFTAAVRQMGRRVLMIDWGPAAERAELDVAAHCERILAPLIRATEKPPALVGYCLGGTLALAASALVPVERIATIATPWHFGRYPADARQSLLDLWSASRSSAEAMGLLPMEVLQGAFWSLDPERTVAKFADFGALDPADTRARRFVALEDWANEGEPLPFPAARELIEDLFGKDVSGRGEWIVGGAPAIPLQAIAVLNLTASDDRIAPAASAADGPTQCVDAGHVGMVVGSARHALHSTLKPFLAAGTGPR